MKGLVPALARLLVDELEEISERLRESPLGAEVSGRLRNLVAIYGSIRNSESNCGTRRSCANHRPPNFSVDLQINMSTAPGEKIA
jgi:hypothetical protein